MWHTISAAISAATSSTFVISHRQQIAGGDSSHAFRVSNSDSDRHYFVKLSQNSQSSMFESEQMDLAQIGKTGAIKCPKVICAERNHKVNFLVLEYLQLNAGNDHDWFVFGQQLATLHRPSTQVMFGYEQDNYIGLTPQSNRWRSQWADFFAEERIGRQLQLLAEKQIKFASIHVVVEAVRQRLNNYQPVISLVHGDLWRGNVGFADHVPVLFDPACYFGDAETDIAMTELFGGFPESFYSGYYQGLPPPPGRQKRKVLYQLYHVLNHANLFGGQYIDQAEHMIKQHINAQ